MILIGFFNYFYFGNHMTFEILPLSGMKPPKGPGGPGLLQFLSSYILKGMTGPSIFQASQGLERTGPLHF